MLRAASALERYPHQFRRLDSSSTYCPEMLFRKRLTQKFLVVPAIRSRLAAQDKQSPARLFPRTSPEAIDIGLQSSTAARSRFQALSDSHVPPSRASSRTSTDPQPR